MIGGRFVVFAWHGIGRYSFKNCSFIVIEANYDTVFCIVGFFAIGVFQNRCFKQFDSGQSTWTIQRIDELEE